MKRSPLAPGKPLRRKTKLRAKNAAKAKPRYMRTFGPDGFAAWLRLQPCVACKGFGPGQKNEVHHEPTRGAGGRWVDTVSLCTRCHRRRHDIGVETFWAEVGMDYGEATSLTQFLWLVRSA